METTGSRYGWKVSNRYDHLPTISGLDLVRNRERHHSIIYVVGYDFLHLASRTFQFDHQWRISETGASNGQSLAVPVDVLNDRRFSNENLERRTIYCCRP